MKLKCRVSKGENKSRQVKFDVLKSKRENFAENISRDEMRDTKVETDKREREGKTRK